jgi:hypothetical protein
MERVDWTLEGPWKRQFEYGVNSLQPGEDDVDQVNLSYFSIFYLNWVYLLVFYSILSFSILFELGFFVSFLN